MTASQAARVEDAVAPLLAGFGVRLTAARRLVLIHLADSPGPLSAGELHRELQGRLPLSSLYRTLAVLEQARVLAKQHDGTGVARYELAEWLAGHHHHVVCTNCGEVRDVLVDQATEAAVTRLTEALARRAGYRATGHRIDIEGVCAACRTA